MHDSYDRRDDGLALDLDCYHELAKGVLVVMESAQYTTFTKAGLDTCFC